MKILITAGGTSEKIDEVRKITNMATGRLGVRIAEEFIKKANASITYVCGEHAVIPSDPAIEVIKIGSAGELLDTLAALLAREPFAAVIHAMAVSDYTVRGAVSIEELASIIAKRVYENKQVLDDTDGLTDVINTAILQSVAITQSDSIPQNTAAASGPKKISSEIANLMLIMGKTPKVISRIKQLQPETILVGFKLLAGVSEDELSQTGHKLLVKNDCDYVLANDLEWIRGDRHEGLLIEPDGAYRRFSTKQEIAEGIVTKVLAKIKD